jgi:hypothetical protein
VLRRAAGHSASIKQGLRYLTCYSDDALTSSVVSIETLVIHDLQTMVTIIQQPTHL